jgi:hypothetical protein
MQAPRLTEHRCGQRGYGGAQPSGGQVIEVALHRPDAGVPEQLGDRYHVCPLAQCAVGRTVSGLAAPLPSREWRCRAHGGLRWIRRRGTGRVGGGLGQPGLPLADTLPLGQDQLVYGVSARAASSGLQVGLNAYEAIFLTYSGVSHRQVDPLCLDSSTPDPGLALAWL